MGKLMCSLSLVLFPSLVMAGPNQIDVVGLIPGVSSISEVRAAGSASGDKLVFLEIGGYKLPCSSEFNDGKLASLICLTGAKYAKASNIEIHETLLEGFTMKFGPPDSIHNTPARTLIGVEYQSSEVWWNDKQGNSLVLYSMQGKIDEGALLLASSAKLQKEKEAIEQQNKARKF